MLATRDWYHPATTGGDITMWEQARYLAPMLRGEGVRLSCDLGVETERGRGAGLDAAKPIGVTNPRTIR